MPPEMPSPSYAYIHKWTVMTARVIKAGRRQLADMDGD